MSIPPTRPLRFLPPYAYGVQSGLSTGDIDRGIGTLPGGMGIFKKDPTLNNRPVLVGGIGVFFPGELGYSDSEQAFNPNIKQSTLQRENSQLALEAEWMAFAAIGGSSAVGAYAPANLQRPCCAGRDWFHRAA